MTITLRISLGRAGEHAATAFYRVYLTTTKGRGLSWKDFRGKRAKSRADAYAAKWWGRMVAKRQTARVRVRRITENEAWIYR